MVELKSYPIDVCQSCGDDRGIHKCIHDNYYCYDCLYKTVSIGEHRVSFKVSCDKDKECVFNALYYDSEGILRGNS